MSNRGGARIGCHRFPSTTHARPPQFPQSRRPGGDWPEPGVAAAPRRGRTLRLVAAAVGHHPVDARRAEPHRHVGPQARRPGRVPRRVRRPSRPTCPASRLTDMLPMCGRIMDKWSIVRSLHHNDAGHSTGDQICFTGYPAGPNPDENVYPSCGSIVVEATRQPEPAPAGLRHDPAHGTRHGPGLSRRGPQAVRDERRPGQPRPLPAAEFRPCRTA